MEIMGMPINEVFILIGMAIVLGLLAMYARKHRDNGSNHYHQ